MRWKTIATTAALTGAMALGLSFGFVNPSTTASAQVTQPTATSTATNPLGSRFLDQLATTLGVQRTALDSAMSSAASSTAAAAVADGTLTQAQADALLARVQAGDYGALFGGRGDRHGGPRVDGLHEAMMDAAAQALGITTDELRTALRDGKTVAELAAAHNTTEQAVTDAALAAAKAKLDQAVAAGTITQAQADTIYADLKAKGLQPGGPGGHGGRGGDRSPPANGTAPGAPTSTPTP